jgi:hypothetical protein
MNELDFTLFDKYTHTPIRQYIRCLYGDDCLHTPEKIDGVYTCTTCGLELRREVDTFSHTYTHQYNKIVFYDPGNRFRELLDSYCFSTEFVPSSTINRLKGLNTKFEIRKWLVKNEPEYAPYSVEAFFKHTKRPYLNIPHHIRNFILNDFSDFLQFFKSQSSKSTPNLSFCLSMLLEKYNIKFAPESISVAISSYKQNIVLWTKFKIFQHI